MAEEGKPEEKEKIYPENLCSSCVHGLAIATLNPSGDYKDTFVFCGFFEGAPLKFRGAYVTDCTRRRPIEGPPEKAPGG